MDYMSYPFLLRHFFARYVRALLFRNFKFSPHTSTLIKMLESLNLLSIIYLCKLLIRITIVLIVVNHTSLLRMLKNTVIQLTNKNAFLKLLIINYIIVNYLIFQQSLIAGVKHIYQRVHV